MALLDTGATPTPIGILVGITPRDANFAIELQRAPDDGTGNPNVGSAVTITTIPPAPLSGIKYPDILSKDGAFRFYRWRHIGVGYDPGTWTGWARGIPSVLPSGSNFQSDTGLYPVRRDLALVDGVYALRATETDGSTKVSDALNGQGSTVPITSTGASALISWKSGGVGTGQMWISFGWSAATAYRPDGTTVAIPAPPAAPSAPTLSQVAGGTLAAATLFVRIAYVTLRNGFLVLYPVSAESSFAKSLNFLLKVTSPPALAGYDGWVVLVGTASNAEFLQLAPSFPIAFGTDWTEPLAGISSTTTQYDNANWKSVTVVGLATSKTISAYPYLDLVSTLLALGLSNTVGGDPVAAQIQLADGHIPITNLVSGTYAGQPATPGAGGSTSGSFGGGRLT